MDLTITGNCVPKDPSRARRELIEQYNRKPSVYVERNAGQECVHFLGGVSGVMSGLFHKVFTSLENKKTGTKGTVEKKDAAGPPSCESCDSIDVSVFKTLQRAICYAGAALGIVGVGVVTLFGLCTAAGAACTVTVCNKCAEKNCNIDHYEQDDGEVYYEGKQVVEVPNDYSPSRARDFMTPQNYIPVGPVYYN